jgi:hypothetical protein
VNDVAESSSAADMSPLFCPASGTKVKKMRTVPRFAALGLLLLASSTCGRTKSAHHSDASGAGFDDGSNDLSAIPSSSDGADASDGFGANDVQSANDVLSASDAADGPEAGCIGAGGPASDFVASNCCSGLVVQGSIDGTFTCSRCVDEGKLTQDLMGQDCCPGLRAIPSGSGPPTPGGQWNCTIGRDSRVCSRCGNGVCEDWERPCGCPEDCGPVCEDKKCPVGSYCLEHLQLPGPDAGTPSYECIDVATDCDGGVFLCSNCASVCVGGCTDRWIVRCGI